MYQPEIKAAYLNDEENEELYIEIPYDIAYLTGFWKLNKSIYCLKQSE